MIGTVDEKGRALLDVSIGDKLDGAYTPVTTWHSTVIWFCLIDWFGNRIRLQVITNEGRFPLLGTGLLEQCVLHIDYAKRELSLDGSDEQPS